MIIENNPTVAQEIVFWPEKDSQNCLKILEIENGAIILYRINKSQSLEIMIVNIEERDPSIARCVSEDKSHIACYNTLRGSQCRSVLINGCLRKMENQTKVAIEIKFNGVNNPMKDSDAEDYVEINLCLQNLKFKIKQRSECARKDQASGLPFRICCERALKGSINDEYETWWRPLPIIPIIF